MLRLGTRLGIERFSTSSGKVVGQAKQEFKRDNSGASEGI